ncbi:16S rRNA (guanine966-N2)-methyltransferase [Erythromicrobium ramosum]|uniref:16S rRNA (Guanine(966)-N(2))-methyltransferase RsmD n=1 Tax=Erythrobacter ramosus TaxID=35811 RepID=A0A6I4UJU8_9SPHN|nr:16S rRNA (guanine(966)-N(2))-methyltransferase RsmD [Erythrobacter ramosus]MBB3775764.1 16S rRNA (guanine966-N2)-methyltransferase [Erythrobacter ramosus]MXP39142.1 16S rRNA (guanine(966)-N(2))-methyltransferase RsmD [Erythrobacter ramosus]
MRVIAGEWRGRKLAAPKGDGTRPTADRARETLFAMLTSRLGDFDGLQIADLFAGSGALGLEALSRGAAHCLFVEQDRAAVDVIRANITALGAQARSRVEVGSVMQLRAASVPLDLILADPPYQSGAGEVALDRLLRLGWIGPQTWIAVETSFKEDVVIKGLTLDAERRVGKGKLSLLRLAASDADPGPPEAVA